MLAQLKRGEDGVEDSAETDDMFAPVLQEIGETVLPRELRFRNDRGEELALIVSARRVLRISEILPGALAAKFPALAEHPLSKDAGPQLQAFRELLETLFAGTEELSVTSTRPSTEATTSDIGWGTDFLARLWSENGPGAGREPEQDLLSALCDAAAAHIVWTDEEITGRKGPDSALTLLQSLAETEAMARPAGADAGPVCTVLPASDDHGTALVDLRAGDVRALFLLPGFGAARIARIWQGSGIGRG